MKKKLKIQYLRILSDNLTRVDKRRKDIFICPTCLDEIDIKDLENISEAHIIPKSAKGNEKTFLCRKCNSIFGSKQDKWFGEMINLHTESKTFGEIELEGRHFTIGDRKIYGKRFTKEDGALAFLFVRKRNSPQDYEYFSEYCKNHKITFSLEYPIMKEENLIKKGYLTAAYLYYFSVFGYSWVLQTHLDSVRKNILNYNSDVTRTYHFIQYDNVNWSPWMGLLIIDSNSLLVMGLNNLLTVLPTYTNKNLEEYFKNVDWSIAKKHLLVFNYKKHSNSVPAQILTYYDTPLIFSDASQGNLSKNLMLQMVTNEGIQKKNLYQTSEEDINKLRSDKRYTINEIILKRT